MDAREELMQVWEMMVQRYKDHPAIIAYDLFNEPNPGDIWSGHPAEFDQDILQPFHEELIKRIRALDPDKLIIYECSIMHDIYDNFFTALPYPNLIYSVHLYCPRPPRGRGGF
jgi:aryl-phospho-beta-D-glucosidase BglC (GH1 family)